MAGVPTRYHGHRPDGAIPKALEQAGLTAGRPRLDRAQRSLRRAGARGHPRPRARSVEGQSARRRDRARPSARRDRRDPHGDARARAAPAPAEVRHGDDVHRHRHGRGGYLRSGLRGAARSVTGLRGVSPRVDSADVADWTSAGDPHGQILGSRAMEISSRRLRPPHPQPPAARPPSWPCCCAVLLWATRTRCAQRHVRFDAAFWPRATRPRLRFDLLALALAVRLLSPCGRRPGRAGRGARAPRCARSWRWRAASIGPLPAAAIGRPGGDVRILRGRPAPRRWAFFTRGV